jgi:hypothetical protein
MLQKNRHSEALDLRKSVGFIGIPLELLSQLVSYLNHAKAPKDKKIVRVLEQLLALEEIGADKMDRPLNELNRNLSRYLFRPLVSPRYDATWHPTQWVVHWYSGRPGRQLPIAKFGPLDMIFDLARAGQLSRLRRCSRCRNWLYAKFRHQLFCSLKCQQKRYTETEAFKAHRRQYMRGRYQQLFAPRGSRKNG